MAECDAVIATLRERGFTAQLGVSGAGVAVRVWCSCRRLWVCGLLPIDKALHPAFVERLAKTAREGPSEYEEIYSRSLRKDEGEFQVKFLSKEES